MVQAEFAALDLIQEFIKNPVMDSVMTAVTGLGDAGFIWIILGLALLCSRKYRKSGLVLMAALAADLVICNLFLKNLVARPRPCDINAAVPLLIPNPADYSFPSGHTAAAFTAVFSLYREKMRLWKPVLCLAAVMAFSRLYLYVHFPTDVLGGIFVGWVCALAGQAFVRHLWPKGNERPGKQGIRDEKPEKGERGNQA